MFATIRKHQQWLWMVIIVIIIISFVVFFSPDIGFGKRGTTSGDAVGTIYGRPLTRQEFAQAAADAQFVYRFNSQRWPSSDANDEIQQVALQRLVMAEKAREMKIHVTDQEVADQIKGVFRDEKGQYRPESYKAFLEQLPRHLDEADFIRFIRAEIARAHLISLFGLSGKVVPSRVAEGVLREESEQVLTEAVIINASNYMSKVEIKTNDFMTLWTNRMASYRIPAKTVVRYVTFESTNYLAEADKRLAAEKDLDVKLDQLYTKRGTNAFTGKDGKPLAVAEAKAQLREEVRDSLALQAATRDASAFAEEVTQKDDPYDVAEFTRIAAEKKLTVKETEPFSAEVAPKDLPEGFTSAARLTPKEPFMRPIVGEKTVYVVAFKQSIPGRPQTLDEVRDKFTDEYKDYTARQLARKAGAELHDKLAIGMGQKKGFKEIVEAQGFKVTEVPPFSRTARSVPGLGESVPFFIYAAAAFDTEPGKISLFRDTSEGGFILHTKARLAADESRMKSELPTYVERVRNQWQSLAFGDWFRKEMEVAKPALNKENTE